LFEGLYTIPCYRGQLLDRKERRNLYECELAGSAKNAQVRSINELTSFITFTESYSLIKELVGLPESTQPSRTLDCLGLFCPEPVFQTRMEIDKLQIGETLEVLADDPAAEEDIKRLTKVLGQELVEFKKENGKLRFLIKRIK